MEKEIEDKWRIIAQKDKQIILLQDKIEELGEFNMKTGSNFNKKEDQLAEALKENKALLFRNDQMISQWEEVRTQLSEWEDKLLQKEEEWSIKYHSVIKKLSELEQKSTVDNGQQKKELELAQAEVLDLKDLLMQRELRVKTLDELVKSLKIKLEKKDKQVKDHQGAQQEICKPSLVI